MSARSAPAPRPLPVEFKLTDSQPELWAPEDVVRIRSHGLTRNVESEVARARVACAAGASAPTALRRKIEPPHPLRVPAGLDPCDIPADVLDRLQAGDQGRDLRPAGRRDRRGDERPHLADLADEAAAEGSNNWVIAPSRTRHRPRRSWPTIRTARWARPRCATSSHLNAPGLSVIGAGEPALPGVTLGHNDKIAFGLTIFPIDQEDLYVYELNPANPRQYRYQGGWEDMTVVHETIAVKGEAPRDVELDFTRHGPVLKIDPAAHRAFALRTIWSEPGTSAYFGSAALSERRRRLDRLQGRRCRHWGAPTAELRLRRHRRRTSAGSPAGLRAGAAELGRA